jgi:hypothetical protein
MSDQDPYDDRSYFADLLAVADSERSVALAIAHEVRVEGGLDVRTPPMGTAQHRLYRLGARDDKLVQLRNEMSTSDGSGGEFIPAGVPVRVARAFAGAVRARAVVAPLLENFPLPDTGMTIEEPLITSGPTVALQVNEGDAVSETDAVTDQVTPAVRTIAGQVDVARQAFERSSPVLDEVIATELGTAYAELLDSHLLNHATDGLLNVTGITSVAYTDATPTVAEFWPKLGELLATTATEWKNTIPALLLHQRRLAWIFSQLATPPTFPPGVRLVSTAQIPTTLGAGTNEDAVLALDPQAVRLHRAPPRFKVYPQVGSSTATVRVQVYGYFAANTARQPKAIGKLTGTGLAAPTFA